MNPELCKPLTEGNEVTELAFLLPGSDAAELERLAGRIGLTTAQLLRRIVSGFLASRPQPSP